MPRPKLLVTGARGFVGRAFLEALTKRGEAADVCCVSRARAGDNSAGVSQYVVADLAKSVNFPIFSAEVVIHMAAEKRDPQLMQSVNVDGTLRMLEWARDHHVRRFIFLSSVGVYGAKKNSGLVTEATAHTPANEYERTKHIAEQNVIEFCDAHRIECVVLQPSNVIAARDPDVTPLLGFIRAVSRGRLVQFGQHSWVNYVAVEDVASALVHACTEPGITRTFILNEDIPLDDLIRVIATRLKADRPVCKWPVAIGLLLGAAGSVCERLLRRSLPINAARVRELSNGTRYDGTRLSQVSNFRYDVSVRQTVMDLADRYSIAGIL